MKTSKCSNAQKMIEFCMKRPTVTPGWMSECELHVSNECLPPRIISWTMRSTRWSTNRSTCFLNHADVSASTGRFFCTPTHRWSPHEPFLVEHLLTDLLGKILCYDVCVWQSFAFMFSDPSMPCILVVFVANATDAFPILDVLVLAHDQIRMPDAWIQFEWPHWPLHCNETVSIVSDEVMLDHCDVWMLW